MVNTEEENSAQKHTDARQKAFDRKLHGMSDEDLIAKVDEWNSKLCESRGEAWMLSIPPDPKRDPDLLISELIRRFKGQRDAVDRLVNAEADQKRKIEDLERKFVLEALERLTPFLPGFPSGGIVSNPSFHTSDAADYAALFSSSVLTMLFRVWQA